MSSYSRPVPPHLKGPRGNPPNPIKHRPTFSATASQPYSAPAQHRDKPARSIAPRPTHHPHSLTVDVSPYSHSATQPLSPTSPPSGDAKHSPVPRPYAPGYPVSQYAHPSAASAGPAPYPAAYSQYVNDVSPHPAAYSHPPPPHFAMSTYTPHMPYPPHPSHTMAPGPPHPYTHPHPHSHPAHPAMFYPRHPSTAGPPPPHFRPSQPYHPNYAMYAAQPAGPVLSRGHMHAQSVQLPASHAVLANSATVVSLSLFDDDDGPMSAPQSARVKPVEEERIEDSERPTDDAQAALRATCQQFILAILTNKQNSSATPPWRAHSDQNDPIVVEYEALYSQMIALSPTLAHSAADGASGRLSGSSTTAPPASSRLSVGHESKPRLSKERRPSRLSLISSALRARLSKESLDPPQPSPPSQPDSASKVSLPAGDDSVSASPRHSFSLLMPSFSTLHALAKVMQITKRVRKGMTAAAKKEAEDKDERRKADEAGDEDEAAGDDQPSASQPAVDDEKQPMHLMIDSLQSHSSTVPSTRLSATQPLPLTAAPLSPASPTSPASSSSRSPRVFRSRYKKQQELSQMQQQASPMTEEAEVDFTVTTVRKPATAAFSYTAPLQCTPMTAQQTSQQKGTDEVVKEKASDKDAAESAPLASPSPSTIRPGRTTVAATPAHRRNVTFAAPPAKSATHLRSLSTLPPLPPLPSSLTARNPTAAASSFAHTAPTALTTRSAIAAKPVTAAAPTTKPRITHHKYNTPSQPRPLLIRSDPARQLHSEKLEAAEHSDKTARQHTAAQAKRLQRRSQLMDKPVKKWGRRGWPHKSRLHVDGVAGRLYWNWKGGAGDGGETDREQAGGRCVDLQSVRAVVAGLSPVERKGVAFATSVLCFSVLGKDRVLECECASVRERDDWMEELRLDVGEAKTRGCVWSGRVLMSIEQDRSIECVVAEEDKGISFI